MIAKKKECNGCHQEKYIYKNVTIDGTRYKLCKDCTFREDLKVQPTKVQIKKTSDKKKKLDAVYSKLRKIQLEKYSVCQINTADCTKQSTEIHHAAYRTGDNFLGVDTWFATCRACHQWVHANPKEARELGFLK
jgi:hypothetical protein